MTRLSPRRFDAEPGELAPALRAAVGGERILMGARHASELRLAALGLAAPTTPHCRPGGGARRSRHRGVATCPAGGALAGLPPPPPQRLAPGGHGAAAGTAGDETIEGTLARSRWHVHRAPSTAHAAPVLRRARHRRGRPATLALKGTGEVAMTGVVRAGRGESERQRAAARVASGARSCAIGARRVPGVQAGDGGDVSLDVPHAAEVCR